MFKHQIIHFLKFKNTLSVKLKTKAFNFKPKQAIYSIILSSFVLLRIETRTF